MQDDKTHVGRTTAKISSYSSFIDPETAVLRDTRVYQNGFGSIHTKHSINAVQIASQTAGRSGPVPGRSTFEESPWTSTDGVFTLTGQQTSNGTLKSVGLQGQVLPMSVLTQNQTRCRSFPVDLDRNVASGTLQPSARRAITSHSQYRNFQQRNTNLLNSYTFQNLNPVSVSWTPSQQNRTSLCSWWGSGVQSQRQRRSVPNLNTVGVLKKVQQTGVPQSFLTPSKFRRSTSFSGPTHQSVGVEQMNLGAFDDMIKPKEGLVACQEQSVHIDTMKFPSFENQLLDIMRTAPVEQQQENSKNEIPYLLEEGHAAGDGNLEQGQTIPNLSSPQSSCKSTLEKVERFSRKVFVGGLPPDIDEDEITAAFRRFGPLVVDWPHKAESKSYFPPKGYSFLIFQDEVSVQNFIEMCLVDDDKMYWCVSSPTMKDKPVQIRPWTLSDSDFVMDGSQPLDPRKTIFVGGVPRPLRAVELAMIMDRLYGGVCYAGIDTDPELKYPKGAGRVAFSSQQSYIAAISARFVQLQHGDIDKRVEVKPYVLDDQMCDECHGSRCAGKFAPFFCANVTCLQYYCEYCWAQIHSRPGREFHKPLVKEGADRPRAVPFRWC